jgi:tRNA (guanine37-N1)-methyltransferase
MTFKATILTLYPEMFPGPLGASIAGRAKDEGKWALETVQIRDFATDKHRTVDDTPAGGGAGMVLKADVLARALDHAQSLCSGEGRSLGGAAPISFSGSDGPGLRPSPEHILATPVPILAMTPRGKPITQARIRELAAGPGVTILCGRFEGFDERLFEARPEIEQVSMGDIVLSGGEMGALMLLDACIRLLPGVMGAALSGDEESFENGLLEYPHYTRPAEWEGRTIPEVLRSGDHAKIAAWRKQRAEDDTRLRRPDLWERHIDARDQPASDARRKTKKDK